MSDSSPLLMFHVFYKRRFSQFDPISNFCFLASQCDATTQADIFVLLSFTTLNNHMSPHILLSDPLRVSRTLYINFILLREV